MNLLTRTSKMGCHSWSLPAGPGVCAGFNLEPGSVCGSCYAAQGMYHMPNVRKAQAERLHAWRTDPTIDDQLVDAINRKRGRYFRVFDSGDFSKLSDVQRWHAICQRCPDKLFWIPTRTWRLGERWLKALGILAGLPNVCVRFSGLTWDDQVPFWGPTTTLVTDGSGDCPAVKNHSSCDAEGCRKCWDKTNQETRIDRHGNVVNWKRRTAS